MDKFHTESATSFTDFSPLIYNALIFLMLQYLFLGSLWAKFCIHISWYMLCSEKRDFTPRANINNKSITCVVIYWCRVVGFFKSQGNLIFSHFLQFASSHIKLSQSHKYRLRKVKVNTRQPPHPFLAGSQGSVTHSEEASLFHRHLWRTNVADWHVSDSNTPTFSCGEHSQFAYLGICFSVAHTEAPTSSKIFYLFFFTP